MTVVHTMHYPKFWFAVQYSSNTKANGKC